jgi:hypothetical protein
LHKHKNLTKKKPANTLPPTFINNCELRITELSGIEVVIREYIIMYTYILQELNEHCDVYLMPRSSSRAALLACKKHYVETMDGLFVPETSTPTVYQLRVRHIDELKKAIADYQLRNELAWRNPKIFEEYQSLLEEVRECVYLLGMNFCERGHSELFTYI